MQIRELKSPAEKAAYVAGITTILTFLGCWAMLAHSSGNSVPRSSANDELFAKKSAKGMIAELKMGRLAMDKGSSEAVKKFGRKMVEDNTQWQDVLKDVAQKEGIALPTDMDASQRSVFDELSKLPEAEFDKAYARNMAKDHQDDIAEFTAEASGGQKSAMRGFATETLPNMREHLKLARELKQNTLTSSASSSTTPAPPKKSAPSTQAKRASK